MSEERELLQRILDTDPKFLGGRFIAELEQLLAQPEPGPSVKLPESEDEAVMMNLLSDNWLRHHAPHRLNQPEHIPNVGNMVEPVAWMQDSIELYVLEEKSVIRGYIIPLYTAPPKREPLSDEGRQRLSKAYSTRAEQVAFEEGIIFAEISYGIGGE